MKEDMGNDREVRAENGGGLEAKEQITIRSGSNARDLPSALWLRAMLLKGLGQASAAMLSIHVDINVPAKDCGQIDLVVQGFLLPPWSRPAITIAGVSYPRLAVRSIIATIEVKNHSKQNVDITAASATVNNWVPDQQYREPQSVTEQSERQLFALKEMITSRLGWEENPWLGRLILYQNVKEADLPAEPHFYLAEDTNFEAFMGRLCFSAMKKFSMDNRLFILNSFKVESEQNLRYRHEQLHGLLGKVVLEERISSSKKFGVSRASKRNRAYQPISIDNKKAHHFLFGKNNRSLFLM